MDKRFLVFTKFAESVYFLLTDVNTFGACFRHTGEKMKKSKFRL